ncbi:MAG TPA: hypothetical protein DDW62_04350 [Marinilabiliaceae bacterium]|nr:hypothetical protein [Marinilabiliaceae bacterium]
MNDKPNILFLMSDEHRADVTGFGGNPVIRTKTLDMLAETGAVFTNAYTPSPVCIPGRQCLMAGQFPRTCGVEHGSQDLPPNYMTFARQLSLYGYDTVACGKLSHRGEDQMQGWMTRIGSDAIISPSFLKGRIMAQTKRKPVNQKWSDSKEIMRAGIGNSGYVTDRYTVTGAINFIDNYFNSSWWDREKRDNPLLLKISLVQPHYPYLAIEEKFNYYLNRVKPYIKERPFDHPFLGGTRRVIPGVDVTERDIRRATAAYYGMIETVDDLFAEVLDKLVAVGEDIDNWLVIYAADHGEMLGQHGVWEKQKFFEGSARVPLIIRYPAKFGEKKIINQNVSLCDIFATLCDICGIPIPQGLDSRSLVPLLKGKSEDWDNEAISQFEGVCLMIKQDNLKYHYYSDFPEVLIDLENDPNETANVIDNSEYSEAVARFRKRRKELNY